ncbi:DNA-binding MarR family transcriptional regulator [Pseudorhizobium tarimense]|uniref:DNA-binding MarR family transcriptional regulator n=1 Tax=Pseudorhizobium tarimense TaxID=1079109 RepID=A0ABV2HCT3_9HYPH|nr:MarR family transcriptional regulator [Pseudorhizobium tarimense]MCJ8521407.1 MarR family transcriptional regulator [Pseudorhizobium tarimense]
MVKKKDGKKKDGKKGKSDKKKDVDGAASAELAAAVTQAARSMRTALSRSLAESGLYAGQDGVILALAELDGLTAGQLASRLGVKAPTMTRTIGRMEVQGFVERRDDGEDRRLTKVFLTERGRATVEQIDRSIADCSALAVQDFSDKEIKSVLRLLKAMDDNLQGHGPVL